MTILKKSTTNRSFIFGDIDGDGTPNIDDKYPLDKNKKQRVQEISLAKELYEYKNAAKSYQNNVRNINRTLRQKGYKTKYRIKSVNSIINKLRRKRLNTLQDIGGLMILTKTREEAHSAAKFIENNYRVVSKDDYYSKKHPSGRFYRAYHYVIQHENQYLEIQIKTRKEFKVHFREHTKYKEGYKYTSQQLRDLNREVENLF